MIKLTFSSVLVSTFSSVLLSTFSSVLVSTFSSVLVFGSETHSMVKLTFWFAGKLALPS